MVYISPVRGPGLCCTAIGPDCCFITCDCESTHIKLCKWCKQHPGYLLCVNILVWSDVTWPYIPILDWVSSTAGESFGSSVSYCVFEAVLVLVGGSYSIVWKKYDDIMYSMYMRNTTHDPYTIIAYGIPWPLDHTHYQFLDSTDHRLHQQEY